MGKIPAMYGDELVPVFGGPGRKAGQRILDGKNRGYALCHVLPQERAAHMQLNNYEIRPRTPKAQLQRSINCRLFIGGIPKMKKRGDPGGDRQGHGGRPCGLPCCCRQDEESRVCPSWSTEPPCRRHGAPQAHARPHPAVGPPDRAVDWAELRDRRGRGCHGDREDPLRAQPHDRDQRRIMTKKSRPVQPGCVSAGQEDPRPCLRAPPAARTLVHAMNNLNGTELEGSCPEVTLGQARRQGAVPRYQKAAKVAAQRGSSVQQPSYAYSCDPHTAAYYMCHPHNALIGPNRDYLQALGFSLTWGWSGDIC